MTQLDDDIEHCKDVLNRMTVCDAETCTDCRGRHDHERLLSYMQELRQFRYYKDILGNLLTFETVSEFEKILNFFKKCVNSKYDRNLENDIDSLSDTLENFHGCEACKEDHERLLGYMMELKKYRKIVKDIRNMIYE